MFCVSLFFFLQHCPTKWKESLGVLGRVCQVKGTFFKATETFVNRKVKNDLWIQMIKKYFQEITDHSYFLHHHGQIRKQTTYLIVVVLKLACASESLGNLNKSLIASPFPFLIQEVWGTAWEFSFWQVPR